MPLGIFSTFFFFIEREVNYTVSQKSDLNELIKLYIKTQKNNLKILNYIMCYVSVLSGLIELLRMSFNRQIPSVVSFFNNPVYNIHFSILMIILGLMIVIFSKNPKIYRCSLFILTCCWGWVAFSYFFSAMFVAFNFKHVLVVPIIAQALYMMKMSVFLDGIA